ncbi:MAG: GNAT family N-acetyltransferase [Acidobacteria bacterium]|nr:GNAT family N-acetyltransferase [Acidobacteriota bacterium]
MAEIDRYRPEDRRGVEALYRRVFGHDAAEASRLRWDWQYRRNPNNPAEGPLIWLAREGTAIVGQYAAMPVRLSLKGREVDAAWGMDVMVAPERQRQGLGEMLFRTWDRHVGASLGLGLSESSYRLFRKLEWPDVGPVPCLVKPLTRRALRRPHWPTFANRIVSALTLPVVKIAGRALPLRAHVEPIRRFDATFTELWDRVAPRFDLAVRRDEAYLNWKYATPPHIRYSIAALRRDEGTAGYAVYRHVHEPRGRATIIADFLVDPDDETGLRTLVGWVDREARSADSDKIRCFAMHAGFRRILRRSGYFHVKSTMEFVVKVNALDLPRGFYEERDAWHVTLGDSDQDR